MRSQITLAILLILSLFFFYNSTSNRNTPILQITTTIDKEDYDYYMLNMDSTHFNLDGSQNYWLRSESLVHYPEPELAEISKPVMHFYQADAQPWQISAESGLLEKDTLHASNRLDLIDNVIIHRDIGDDDQFDLYTDFLSAWPDNKLLATDRPILMNSKFSTTSGTGMEADLNIESITILADVEGTYAQ